MPKTKVMRGNVLSATEVELDTGDLVDGLPIEQGGFLIGNATILNFTGFATVTDTGGGQITVNVTGGGGGGINQLTGDVLAGPGSGSQVATLSTTGITAATYGDASHVAQVTFDAKGRATGAANVAISIPSSAVTAPGNNTDVVFNSGGAFAANAAFTTDGSGHVTMSILTTGDIIMSGIIFDEAPQPSADMSNRFLVASNGSTQNLNWSVAHYVGINGRAQTASEAFGVSGDVHITGKLTVDGAIDPPSLSLSGGTALFIDSSDGSTAPLSAAGHGRLRYNNGAGAWQVSINGGVYVSLVPSGITGSGTAGQVTFFTASTAVSSNAGFTFNSGTGFVGLGGATQSGGGELLGIVGDARIADLLDAAGGLSVRVAIRELVDSINGTSIDWQQRQAFGSDGSTLGLDYNTPGIVQFGRDNTPGSIRVWDGIGGDDFVTGSYVSDTFNLIASSAGDAGLRFVTSNANFFELIGGGGATLTPGGTFTVNDDVHITGKLTVDGMIDPTQVLLSGADKKFGATDTGAIYLAAFDSSSSVQVRDSDNVTLSADFRVRILYSVEGVSRVDWQNCLLSLNNFGQWTFVTDHWHYSTGGFGGFIEVNAYPGTLHADILQDSVNIYSGTIAGLSGYNWGPLDLDPNNLAMPPWFGAVATAMNTAIPNTPLSNTILSVDWANRVLSGKWVTTEDPTDPLGLATMQYVQGAISAVGLATVLDVSDDAGSRSIVNLASLSMAGADKTISAADAGAIHFYPQTDQVGAFVFYAADITTTVLSVDTTNNRVGIGVGTPAYNLDVNGDFHTGGSVTIGTNVGANFTFSGDTADITFDLEGVATFGVGILLADNTVITGTSGGAAFDPFNARITDGSALAIKIADRFLVGPDGTTTGLDWSVNGVISIPGTLIVPTITSGSSLAITSLTPGSGSGSDLSIIAGSGSGAGAAGGALTVSSGDGDGGNGGILRLQTGQGANVTDGGEIQIASGHGDQTGGNLTITTGTGDTGDGGSFSLVTGTSQNTNSGGITIRTGNAPANAGNILVQAGSGGTTNGIITMLDASGSTFSMAAGGASYGNNDSAGWSVDAADNWQFSDGSSNGIAWDAGSTLLSLTGAKISVAGTSIGLYAATPVTQHVAIANATNATDVITQLNTLLAAMRSLGAIAT